MESLVSLSLNTGRFTFTCVLASHVISHARNTEIPLICPILMTLMKLSITNSYHFQTCGLERQQQPRGCLWSFLHLLQSQPLGGQCGIGGWSKSSSPGESFQGEFLGWSHLNGCGIDGFICRCPGLLALIWYSVTAWVIACQPSWMVKGSAAR